MVRFHYKYDPLAYLLAGQSCSLELIEHVVNLFGNINQRIANYIFKP
jgi:hypothetical protein